MLGFLTILIYFCEIMVTERNFVSSLVSLVEIINKWQRENLHTGYNLSLPVLKWRLNTAMTVSIIQL